MRLTRKGRCPGFVERGTQVMPIRRDKKALDSYEYDRGQISHVTEQSARCSVKLI